MFYRGMLLLAGSNCRMIPPAVNAGPWPHLFGLVFIFVVYQQTDLDAKREEMITRLEQLEADIKGDMKTGSHGDMHEPQESRDTRSVKLR